ncbi:MAG: hypothetical protein EPO64_08400 [Nitrospirae bacterium]|nr:MAG: hypothetical protein EPO64_08400 [Nitrospirota bacterium]
MPVNMDPQKRRKKPAVPGTQQEAAQAPAGNAQANPASAQQPAPSPKDGKLGEITERDRELALAEAELKHLWDATEVIDMDKW